MSRLPLWERPVAYGAVGATQALDLMQYPPAGFRPVVRRTRIGFGEARWNYATTCTLSWGIQRASGFRVELSDSPAAVTDVTYVPVGFDDQGAAIEPSSLAPAPGAQFAPDGSPILAPGDTANLVLAVGAVRVGAPVRVVYVIDEPTRKGFAYGTLVGHPVSGEESWIIERDDDGSVWMVIRAFSRPARWYWWAIFPALRMSQAVFTRRYERALMGPIPD